MDSKKLARWKQIAVDYSIVISVGATYGAIVSIFLDLLNGGLKW